MIMRPASLLAAAALSATLGIPLFAADTVPVTALVNANVVDLEGGAPLRDAVVLIEGERITAIGARTEVPVPPGSEMVDAGGSWLIPGLMNMHVHLGLMLPGKMEAELANETEGELTLRMAKNAYDSLMAGVTTIRCPGDQRHGDLALKKSIAKGEAHGPRIFSSGEGLAITGGHGSERGGSASSSLP